jgi:hypothetical protein
MLPNRDGSPLLPIPYVWFCVPGLRDVARIKYRRPPWALLGGLLPEASLALSGVGRCDRSMPVIHIKIAVRWS